MGRGLTFQHAGGTSSRAIANTVKPSLSHKLHTPECKNRCSGVKIIQLSSQCAFHVCSEEVTHFWIQSYITYPCTVHYINYLHSDHSESFVERRLRCTVRLPINTGPTSKGEKVFLLRKLLTVLFSVQVVVLSRMGYLLHNCFTIPDPENQSRTLPSVSLAKVILK